MELIKISNSNLKYNSFSKSVLLVLKLYSCIGIVRAKKYASILNSFLTKMLTIITESIEL